jgi:hypothetical protein
MYFADIRYGVCNGFDNVNHLAVLIVAKVHISQMIHIIKSIAYPIANVRKIHLDRSQELLKKMSSVLPLLFVMKTNISQKHRRQHQIENVQMLQFVQG